MNQDDKYGYDATIDAMTKTRFESEWDSREIKNIFEKPEEKDNIGTILTNTPKSEVKVKKIDLSKYITLENAATVAGVTLLAGGAFAMGWDIVNYPETYFSTMDGFVGNPQPFEHFSQALMDYVANKGMMR